MAACCLILAAAFNLLQYCVAAAVQRCLCGEATPPFNRAGVSAKAAREQLYAKQAELALQLIAGRDPFANKLKNDLSTPTTTASTDAETSSTPNVPPGAPPSPRVGGGAVLRKELRSEVRIFAPGHSPSI